MDTRSIRSRGHVDAVLSKNPIDAVRRADSTLDTRRVATFVTAESLCSARPVCRLFPKCCSSSSWPSRAGSTSSSVTSLTLSRKRIASSESKLGPGRLRCTDAQRRRLAAQAKRLGRRVRRDLHTLVTPDTLPPLASTADREAIRRPRPSRTGPPTGHGHDPPAHRPDGPREPRVGRHP